MCSSGLINLITPIQTWSDDFSMAIAGVPSMRNDFSGTFMEERYHTQFDDETTYDEKAYLYHHNLYGMLVLAYDHLAVAPLDFTTRLEALAESFDTELLAGYEISVEGLVAQVAEAITYAAQINERVAAVNASYQVARNEGDLETARTLAKEAASLQAQLLAIYKLAEDNFVRLTWEDETIFPHEAVQGNLEAIGLSIDCLKEGDAVTPIDEYLFLVDNNWYAYDFEEAVYDYFTDYVRNQPAERLMWGAGRITGGQPLRVVRQQSIS